MSESSQRKLGVIFSYVSIILYTVIQLLYTPLLIRKLGQSEWGLYSLVASIIGYLTIMDFGFGNAIIVYTSKYRSCGNYDSEKKLHGMFKIIFILIGIITGILGIVLFLCTDHIFSATMSVLELKKMKIMILIMSFNLMLSFSFSIYNSIISAYEKFVYQKLISIVGTLLKPILMIPLLFMGYKSVTMCVVITFVNAIIIFSNYFYCTRKLKISVKFYGFDSVLFKTIFNYSIWIFLGIIVDKVNWSVDNFVLGAVSGTAAVSIYALAATLNNVFVSLSNAANNVMLPKISKMVSKNANNEVLTNEFIKIGRIQYLIIFLMASGLVLFGKNFIQVWAGKTYTKSYYIALLLIIPTCVPLIQNIGVSILQAKNKHKFRSILLICISVFNIIISIPLAKFYGGIGAAVGTALSVLIGNVLILNFYYYKKIGINVIKFWTSIIKMSIPFSIPIISIVLIMKLLKISGLSGFILYGSIYSILYIIFAYLFSMNEYEKSIIKIIINKIGLFNKIIR